MPKDDLNCESEMANCEEDTTRKPEELWKKLLRQHTPAILHMRAQLRNKRLGVVLGAGVSIGVGLPSWKGLLDRLAESVGAPDRSDGRLAAEPANVLFERFVKQKLSEEDSDDRQIIHAEYGNAQLELLWKLHVKDVLYEDCASALSGDSESAADYLESKCCYLRNLVRLIQRTEVMTVTYNFDDIVELMLSVRKQSNDQTRGFAAVWDMNVQEEKRGNIIYHPNGYLPHDKSQPSNQLIFSEDTFEDQLIDSFGGHYNALSHHYSMATCIFLGLSLDDRTLTHMLRQNARKCPGHVHYYIRHLESEGDRVELEAHGGLKARQQANLNSYNLYTMFLTDNEIDALLRLLMLNDEEFLDKCEEANVYNARKYYIVGSVAVGKSTAVRHLRSFQTFDEWLDEMPEDMVRAPETVADTSIKNIDSWIAGQIPRKNRNLANKCFGVSNICVIDRSPIDALAFTPNGLGEGDEYDESLDEWKGKAELILGEVNKGPNPPQLEKGMIVYLHAEEHELYNRALRKEREGYDVKTLKQQDAELGKLVDKIEELWNGSTCTIDATSRSSGEVAHEILNLIYFGRYVEADCQKVYERALEEGYRFVSERQTSYLPGRAALFRGRALLQH